MAHRSMPITNQERITQECNDELLTVLKSLVKEQKKTNELLSKLVPQEPEVVEPVVAEVKKAKKG